MYLRYRSPGALLVSLSLLAGCSSATDASGSGVLVVTTVSPITNIVQNIGGGRVSVTGIVPEGTNSHTFEPAPADAALMEEADIVFINGLHLEEPTRELAEANVGEGVPIVELADRTISEDEYIFDFSFPESGGFPNPHLWTNPPYAKRFAEIVKDELSKLDPEGTSTYEENFDAFAKRLDALDTAVRAATATIPEEDRKLLTYHDSFPYFAREYGWEVVGAIQPSDFAEPTPRELVALIEQIRDEDLPAIFGSEVFPSPVLEQIAAETGATYVDDLRDDDLPAGSGDPDHSYLGLMVFDFTTIVRALGGDPSVFDDIDVTNLATDDTASYRY
ncbi:MAG TPA: metal ABC transporter substrate-binding protein [Actinomycetota bacterium]|nr:metal ABC transporter substrate-binding protein [Actinomycetota bacterium]